MARFIRRILNRLRGVPLVLAAILLAAACAVPVSHDPVKLECHDVHPGGGCDSFGCWSNVACNRELMPGEFGADVLCRVADPATFEYHCEWSSVPAGTK